MIKKKFSAPTPRAYFGSDKISSWEGTFILADLSRHGLVRRIRTFSEVRHSRMPFPPQGFGRISLMLKREYRRGGSNWTPDENIWGGDDLG